MKKRWASVLMILCCGLAPVALAGPPECVGPPGDKGPHGNAGKWKVTLLHCGCAEDGAGLEFVEITVANRSKGHLRHVAGSFDSCSTDGETFFDFVRTGSDCQIDDGQALIGDEIAYCTNQETGQACGEQVID